MFANIVSVINNVYLCSLSSVTTNMIWCCVVQGAKPSIAIVDVAVVFKMFILAKVN
jgi:hypothetical protein